MNATGFAIQPKPSLLLWSKLHKDTGKVVSGSAKQEVWDPGYSFLFLSLMHELGDMSPVGQIHVYCQIHHRPQPKVAGHTVPWDPRTSAAHPPVPGRYTWLFTWVLGIQIQVLILVRQVID